MQDVNNFTHDEKQTHEVVVRKSRGNPLWAKGVSANPNGRPKKILTAQELFERKVKQDLKSAARDYSHEALQTMLDIMRDVNVAPQYRLTAASSILDRSHGKPVNQTEISVGVYEKLSDAELVKFITGNDMIDVSPATHDDDASTHDDDAHDDDAHDDDASTHDE
jgi:hypothetical protein